MNQLFKGIVLLTLNISLFTSCIGHDAQKIAEEYCKCREVEKYEGTMQGTQCFEDWEQKYGKIRFSESQKKTFYDITNACNPKK